MFNRMGMPYRLNFIDPFYDYYPGFYTGPAGYFDYAYFTGGPFRREPFPLNYDFFLENWHGMGGWGNIYDMVRSRDAMPQSDSDADCDGGATANDSYRGKGKGNGKGKHRRQGGGNQRQQLKNRAHRNSNRGKNSKSNRNNKQQQQQKKKRGRMF